MAGAIMDARFLDSAQAVGLALLKAAIVRGHNERYGQSVTDFEKLVDVFIVLDHRAILMHTPIGSRIFDLPDGEANLSRPH
jgi:hypothetical protein